MRLGDPDKELSDKYEADCIVFGGSSYKPVHGIPNDGGRITEYSKTKRSFICT